MIIDPLYAVGVLGGFAILTPLVDYLSMRLVRRLVAPYWAMLSILLALGMSVYAALAGSYSTSLTQLYRGDAFAVFFTIVFLIVGFLVNLASLQYMKENPNQDTYYLLLLTSLAGMSLIAFATDLLALFIAWELMSIPTYVLTGLVKDDPLSNEASLKFFILGIISSAFILYGISLIFGVTHTTSLYQIYQYFTANPTDLPTRALLLLSSTVLIAGFGLKMAIVPFHMWIPDTYEGAPTTISALLSSASKKAGFAAGLRVLFIAVSVIRVDWALAFAVLAVLTMTLGNIAALTQRNIKRLLAYSSIAQAGYILIGFAVPAFLSNGTPSIALSGALLHILNHAVMTTAAFIAAAAVFYKLHTISLDDYAGLGKRMPLTAFTLTISLLALAGVPPLNGFWSKLYLFQGAVEGGLWQLALIGFLNSAFSLAYYAWIIKRMYLDPAADESRVGEPRSFTATLIISTVLIIGIGLLFSASFNYANSAAQTLILKGP